VRSGGAKSGIDGRGDWTGKRDGDDDEDDDGEDDEGESGRQRGWGRGALLSARARVDGTRRLYLYVCMYRARDARTMNISGSLPASLSLSLSLSLPLSSESDHAGAIRV